jgi:hypothetical protein
MMNLWKLKNAISLLFFIDNLYMRTWFSLDLYLLLTIFIVVKVKQFLFFYRFSLLLLLFLLILVLFAWVLRLQLMIVVLIDLYFFISFFLPEVFALSCCNWLYEGYLAIWFLAEAWFFYLAWRFICSMTF